jgi:hypothetical protein
MCNEIKQLKECRKCFLTKSLDEFHKHPRMADGHLNTCKACHYADVRARLKRKHSEYAPVKKAWMDKNAASVSASREAYKASDRARHLKQKSDYAKRHSATYRAYGANYRAVKLNATVPYDEFNEFAINETYDLCKLRSKMLGVVFHVDHIVPLVSDKVCGLHTFANLQILEGVANRSKGNRHWPGMPGEEI